MTAVGHVERGRNPEGMRKVSITLDVETFDSVRERALLDKCSFAEAARTLITWGLESAHAA